MPQMQPAKNGPSHQEDLHIFLVFFPYQIQLQLGKLHKAKCSRLRLFFHNDKISVLPLFHNVFVLNERARNLIRNLEQFVLEYICTIVICNECNIIYFDMNDAQL